MGCLAERYGEQLAEALPEADAVLGFDSYPQIGERLDEVLAGRPIACARSAPTGARCCRSARSNDRRRRPRWRCPGTSGGRPECAGGWTTRPSATSSSPRAATAGARSAPSRPSVARSSPGRRPTCWPRRPGWPRTGCASWCWSARTPPPTARISPTCARWRRCCRGWPTIDGHRVDPGVLPPAGRAAAVPAAGDRRHAGRGAVLRPVLPARLDAGAAPDEAVRFHRVVRVADRAGPGAGADRRGPQQRDRRLSRRDRAGRGRAGAVPDARPAGRGRRVRLLRRGRHRGRAAGRQAGPGADRRTGRAGERARRGADEPARRGSHRRAGRGAGRVDRRTAR